MKLKISFPENYLLDLSKSIPLLTNSQDYHPENSVHIGHL